MRNHDPAGKMKEQERKETKERKEKLERGEKKRKIRKERKNRKEEPKSKGNLRKPKGKTERKQLAFFHAVWAPAVWVHVPRDSARAAPRRTAVAAMRPRRGPETAPRPVTFPPGDARQPTNRGQPDGDRR